MVKIVFSFSAFLLSAVAMAQSGNVGIGTTNPTEKLDVNGNVNITGQIRLNGDGGEPGNILSVGYDGNPVWSTAGQFTNYARYFDKNASVTIPATVKKFMIEAWSAGGGGARGGGGASGNYVMGVFSNNAATTLTISVGVGGNGAIAYQDAGTTGGATTITGPNVSITAFGGRAANAFFGGLLPNNGILGGTASGGALLQSIVLNGENGMPTKQTTAQVSATLWHTEVHFGRGGHGVLSIGRGGHGSYRVHNAAHDGDGSAVALYQGGYAGIASGGGGGQRLGYGWGWDGGNGYVIIRY